WKLREGEVDVTVMRVIVAGRKKGRDVSITYDLFDRYDEATAIHSMARTTGYTATVAARMVARGLFARKGLSAPEAIGQVPECVKFMLDGLRERGVVYHE